jgi:hypothetical protein
MPRGKQSAEEKAQAFAEKYLAARKEVARLETLQPELTDFLRESRTELASLYKERGNSGGTSRRKKAAPTE